MYNHKEIEKKWQKFWQENKTFKVENPNIFNTGVISKPVLKPKYYILDMFPYPSWAGLHVGHPKWYVANDILARFKHTNWYNVLHPMWWDAFWLPAENYAIKTWTHPRITTDENIETYKKQLSVFGFSYDWDREIDTTDPNYYKWTQWIFLKLFENWLAYEQDLPINYCPSCKTGLANEEVLNDFTCERCGTKVEKRKIRQWVLAITKYAERLLNDVDKLDWPESIKEMQRNWIWKSEGCEFKMERWSEDNERLSEDKIQKISEDNENIAIKKWELDLSVSWTRHSVLDKFSSNEGIMKNEKMQEKNEACISKGVGLNCPAKASLDSSIFKNIQKVKKKTHFFNKIEGLVVNKGEKINFNSKNILKHFKTKNTKEFHYRKNLLWTICFYLEFIDFKNNVWHIIFKKQIIKIVLWEQKNGNYFVKTYYQDDNFTKLYRSYLQEQNKIEKNFINSTSSHNPSISVYTTRIDTVFGMTYVVLAPDHKDINDFITSEQKEICEKYIKDANSKSDQDRTADNKEKTWIFTGSYVTNPFNNEKVPVWIWDYVLWNYGTWAVMAVPAHDERDFEFAKKYWLEIKQSIARKFIHEWINSPKKDKETINRNIIKVILENDNNEILLINEVNWKNSYFSFIAWWIENNETELDAVKKEIIEETWYTDFDIVEPINLSYVSWKWYRHTKDKNQNIIGRCFYVKLKSDKQIQSEIEEGKHTVNWYKKENINNIITWADDLEIYNLFLNWEKAFTEYGILVNSSDFDWLTSEEAKIKMTKFAEKQGFWTKKINYKLRDWLFSRQRYWWEPIPLIHLETKNLKKLEHISDLKDAKDKNKAYILKRKALKWENCIWATCDCWSVRELVINQKVFSKIYDGIYGKIVCDYNLALKLPEVENYEPSGDWNSPLTKVDNFVNIKLAKNLVWKRETNTMPQWWWSCWYYLRFMDPKNNEKLVDTEIEKYWGQVDSYVWWAEHAVLHLLYARFWHKFLFDIWVVSTDEPFYRLRNQWLILAHAFERKNWWLLANDLVEEKDGKYFEINTWEEVNRIISKMSKSLKNVVNPDTIVEEYWADSLRLYEMYLSDFKDTAPWDTKGIIWVRRFLEKTERLFWKEAKISTEDDNFTMKLLHKTIKKVWEDIENYKFNTAIASLMILVNNGLPKEEKLQVEWKSIFIRLLHPFAPHLAEELWERYEKLSENKTNLSSEIIWKKSSVYNSVWPKYDEKMIIDDTIKIWVQILGKLRWEIEISKDEDKESVLKKAKENEDIKKWLEEKIIIKEIYVPGRIVNLVIK